MKTYVVVTFNHELQKIQYYVVNAVSEYVARESIYSRHMENIEIVEIINI